VRNPEDSGFTSPPPHRTRCTAGCGEQLEAGRDLGRVGWRCCSPTTSSYAMSLYFSPCLALAVKIASPHCGVGFDSTPPALALRIPKGAIPAQKPSRRGAEPALSRRGNYHEGKRGHHNILLRVSKTTGRSAREASDATQYSGRHPLRKSEHTTSHNFGLVAPNARAFRSLIRPSATQRTEHSTPCPNRTQFSVAQREIRVIRGCARQALGWLASRFSITASNPVSNPSPPGISVSLYRVSAPLSSDLTLVLCNYSASRRSCSRSEPEERLRQVSSSFLCFVGRAGQVPWATNIQMPSAQSPKRTTRGSHLLFINDDISFVSVRRLGNGTRKLEYLRRLGGSAACGNASETLTTAGEPETSEHLESALLKQRRRHEAPRL